MARVLFYTGASMLAVSATLLYLPTYFSFILAIVISVVLIFLFIFRKKIVINGLKFVLSVVLIFTLFGLFTYSTKVNPAEKMVDFNAEIIGTVCERPLIYDTYTVYFIETEQITLIQEDDFQTIPTDIPQNLKIRVSDNNELNANVFDKLHLTIEFNDLNIYRNSSLANKVYANGYLVSIENNLGQNRPFYAFLYDLRDWLNNRLFDNMNFDDAAVVSAVLLGDRSNLDPDFESDSKAAGITHMLVVSGMHLGIIFQLLSKTLALFKIGRIKTNLLILAAIFCMTAICGFTPSILRAALTYVIIVIGNLIFKKPDSLNSLGAATIILLFSNPFAFANLAFLLSLFSTFGILYLCPIIADILTSHVSKIFTPGTFTKCIIFSTSQSLAATLATLPISIIYLGYISLVAPITNLLTGYASTLLTSFSFVGVSLLSLPSFLSGLSAIPLFVIYALVRYIVKATHICANINFSTIPARSEYLISLAILAVSIPLLTLAKKWSKKTKLRISLKLCASFMVLLSLSSALLFYNISPKNEIAIPDVGRGTSVLIKTESGLLAVGTGDAFTDYNKIENTMVKMCKQNIDHIVIPSANKNFAAGATEMIFNNPNAKIIYPDFGNYTDDLNLISNENFKSFDYKISFYMGDTEIITFANIGTTVNFTDRSLIIYTGKGDINTLFKECKTEKPILICSNSLYQDLEYEISECIVNGSDREKKYIKQTLKKQKVDFTIVDSQTVSIEF